MAFYQGLKSLFSAYIDFWRKAFDFKSRTNRFDYLCGTCLNFFLLVILYVLNFQSFQSHILSSSETGGISSFFPFPSWFQAICLIYVVPGWSITVRRLNDIEEPRGKVFYLLFPVYKTWLFCLTLRPTKKEPSNDELSINKPYMQRRVSSIPGLVSILQFIFPLSSTIFGIRQRSAVLAIMPATLWSFIYKLKAIPLLIWGIDFPHYSLSKFLFGVIAALSGAYWANKITNELKQDSLAFIKRATVEDTKQQPIV